MSRLPADVVRAGRAILPEEVAEVVLGDLLEEAGQRFGPEPSLRRNLWIRLEFLRSAAAVLAGGLRDRLGGRRAATTRREGESTARGWRTLVDDVRFALRMLARRPGFTLFAAGILSLGVGSATAVYSAVERVILAPLPYPDADRMVLLWRTTDGATIFTPDRAHVRVWRTLDVFEEMEAYHAGQATLTGRGDPEALRLKATSAGYFDLLGVRPELGRAFTSEEHHGEGARVALLSHEFWTTRFGADRSVIGQTLTLDDVSWTVVGVLPPRVYPPNSGPGLTDVWIPLGNTHAGKVWPVARLRAGVSLERADARLEALAEAAPEAGLGPPAEWRGKTFAAESFGRTRVAGTLRTLFAGVVLLLLVAAVNVSNLLVQRASARERETAVRAALGAGTARLLRSLAAESLVLAGLGGAVGVALAWVALDALAAVRPERVAWVLDGARVHPRVLAFSLLVSLGTALVTGLLPALRLLHGDRKMDVLRGRRAGGGDATPARARWLLVAGEVGLSFALLTASLLVLGSLAELRSRDPGYRTAELLGIEVELPDWQFEAQADRRAVFERLLDDILRLPRVAEAAVSDALPPGMPGTLGRLHPEGADPADETSYVRNAQVSPGFLSLLGQPLLGGRDLTETDDVGRGDRSGGAAGDEPVVIGRALARRLFPRLPPAESVGRSFSLDGSEGGRYTVVGIAGDIRVNGLAYESESLLMYRPRTNWSRSQTLAIRLEPGTDPASWARSFDVRGRVLAVAPEAVVEVEPAATAMAATLGQERFTTQLMGAFAVLALLLAGVGLYGVLSRSVTHRTREIGIRMSLGADRRSVRTLILRAGAGATAAGLGGGALLAWLGVRLLSTRLFGLEAGRPEAYLSAGAVLALVSLVAIWLPARRATRLDPAAAIRSE